METNTTLRLLMGIMIIFPTDADGLAFEAKTAPEEAEGFLKEWVAKGALRLAEDGQFHLQDMALLDAEYKRLALPAQPMRDGREVFELAIRSVASRICLLQQLYLGKSVEREDGVLTPEHRFDLLARILGDIGVLNETPGGMTHPLLDRLRILLKLAMQEACTEEEMSRLIFTAGKKADD